MRRPLFIFPLISVFVVTLLLTLSAHAEEMYMFSDEKVPDGWTVASGEWEVIDGQLTVDASGEMATIFFGDPEQQNYEISARITFEDVDEDSRWASIIFRAGEEGKTPWSHIFVRFDTTTRGGIGYAVRKEDAWAGRSRANRAKTPCELDKARELRVVVQGTQVEAYLDGQRLIQSPFCVDRDHGCIGLAAAGCVVKFDDVTIKPLPPSKVTFQQMKRQPCEVVAHRGNSAVAPENTLASIREAIKAGADGCEFDVYPSSDGKLILFHDTKVDRTTNGTGKVWELSFAELRKLDAGSWKDKKYAGEKIPTLDEALAVLKDSGCMAVIEVKREGIFQKVVDAVRRADMLDQATVISFSEVVREVRQLEPKLPCFGVWSKNLDGTPEEQVDQIISEAKKYNTNKVDLYYRMFSPEVIRGLKSRGMKVWCWTVNDPIEMDALMRWGIDGITTDRPNEAVRLNKAIK